MKKIILLFLSGFFFSNLFSQYDLEIQVENIYTFLPVQNAYVEIIHQDGKHAYFKAGETGKLRINTSGKINLNVVAPGFQSLSTHFEIQSDMHVGFLMEPEAFSITEKPDVYLESYILDAENYQPLSGEMKIFLPKHQLTVPFYGGKLILKKQKLQDIWQIYKEDDTISYELHVPGYKIKTVKERIPKAYTVKAFKLEKISRRQQRMEYARPLQSIPVYIKQLFEQIQTQRRPGQTQCDRMPSTIRVGINCNCNTCSNVQVMALESYVRTGLNDEWIASWHMESLKAGTLPYRTYGAYYVYHPINNNYDISSTTCKQVWDSDYSTRCIQAQQATQGEYLETAGGAVAFSEYSAENNCLNTTACNCGDGYSGNGTDWPCIQDVVCQGHDRYGHGRGMCQWGTSRWANAGQVYTWMADHYYNPGHYFRCGTTHPHPDFALQNAQSSASSGVPGDVVSVNVQVVNNTSYKTDKNQLKVYFSQDQILDASDTELNQWILWPINPNAFTTKSGNVTIPSVADGNYYFLFVADPDDEMYETDENNNVISLPFTVSTTAVDQNILADKIQIYPNPTSDIIFIKTSPGIELHEIKLTGLAGRVLFELHQPTDKLSLQSFPPGVYMLHLRDVENNRITFKIIKNP